MKLLLAPLVLIAALALVPSVAAAQPLAECTPSYEGALTFAADPTTAQPGQTVTLTGSGWPANSLVPLTFQGSVIGNAETDGAGNFTFTYTIPSDAAPGSGDFSAVCCEVSGANGQAAGRLPQAAFASFETAQAASSCPSGEALVLTQTVQIVTSAATTAAPSSDLPATGSDSSSLVYAAVVLIVAGGLIVFLAARRRSTTVSQ